MIRCPGCNADMRFDIMLQKLVCDYCGTQIDAEAANAAHEAKGDLSIDDQFAQIQAELNSDEESSVDEYYEASEFCCPSCGGSIVSDHDTAITFCSYCGSSVSLEKRTTRLKKPDIVIPFKKTKEECAKAYKDRIKMALFAPKSMTEDASIDKLRGIYMPYWVYDFDEQSYFVFSGTRSYRSGDYVTTDYMAFSYNATIKYTGAAFDASAAFSDRFSQAVGPFDLKDSYGFSEGCISGFYADAGDVEATVYETDAREQMTGELYNSVKGSSTFRKFTLDNNSAKTQPVTTNNSQRLAYFPVWFLANKFKDKVSYAVVNGQNGNVVADIPIDFKKYLFGSLILSVPVILLLNLMVYITPINLLVLTMIFSLVSYWFADKQLNREYTRMLGFDDKGLQLSRYGNVQNPAAFQVTNKSKGVWKSIMYVLMVISIVVLFFVGLLFTDDFEVGVFASGVGYLFFNFIIRTFENIISGTNKGDEIVVKRSFGEKLKVLIKPLTSLVLVGAVMILRPVRDIWYYGTAIASMVLVLISFFDLVILHNHLAMCVPPQFGKRGGDR